MLGNLTMMKQIIIASLLLNIYFYPLFSMEPKPIHRCRKQSCGILFFTKDQLSNHQAEHRNKLKNKKIVESALEQAAPSSIPEPLYLAQVALATGPMKTISYKEFCKLELETSQHYKPQRSRAAVLPSQKKSKITQESLDVWYNNLKKYECCQQFTEQHSYKKHVILAHPNLYNFHHCTCPTANT